MILGQGVMLGALGVVVGVVAAFGLTRLMTSLLYDVRPSDPLTFVGVSVLLIGVSLLASGLPAIRAARVSPMVAMRAQ
jgi:ABC-type antimicrobial peptide transport system permease subunit